MFDNDAEDFLDRLPYPKALSRQDIYQGDMWMLQTNVEYVYAEAAHHEREHTEAVQAAHDEHDDDKREGEAEGRAECIVEVNNEITNILITTEPEDLKEKVEEYLENLK